MLFSKIHELIYFQQERFASSSAFNHKIIGRWEARSTKHFIEQMNALSTGLLHANLEQGSHVIILATHGSPEFLAIDLACLQVGLVTIPLNPKHTSEEFKHIISEIKPVLCFVNEDLLATKILDAGLTKDRIVGFGNSIKFKSWSDLQVKKDLIDLDIIKKREQLVSDTDLATIIYTSGSTGLPKGVMLSHKNIVSNIKAIISLLPVNYRHKVASYLPLSHIFERMVIYTYIALGAKIYFIDNPSKLMKYMREIKPNYISSVPRVLEKIYNEINIRVKKSNALVKAIVRFALNTGQKQPKNIFSKLSNFISLQFADFMVYRRWRNLLGGQLKAIIVGAAAMPPHIARLYSRAGIHIKEGYGLSETSPVISFNRFEPGGTKFGTVGIPIPGIEVLIDNPGPDGSGEIIVRGHNVMLGYYNNDVLTREKIDVEGWFHTGDIGEFVDNRFLKITDRKKDIFKTSSGQYVSPQKVENLLRQDDAVDQCLAIGFQKPHVAVLIVPDFVNLKAWCKTQGIHWTAELYMVENDSVKAYYNSVLERINKHLKTHEKIHSYRLLPSEWSMETGEYTSTLKLRRKFITEKYAEQVDLLYK